MAKDPAQVAQNWANRLGASGDKIKQGVDAVTIAPGQAAARQATVWQQNTTAAAGKWARNTAAVSLADWRTAVETKGIPRIGAGAAAAVPKMTTFMSKLLPFVANAKASLPARGSYEQNKTRALAMMDAMHKFVK